MSTARLALRSTRATRFLSLSRPFSAHALRFASSPSSSNKDLNARANDTSDEYRRIQQEKKLNPHFTNTTSTIANEMPSVGKDAPPPELLSAVDDNFEPRDSVRENTERMTGGTQGQGRQDIDGGSGKGSVEGELGVGEMEGAKFKVEPLRRTGEDANTMRARLLYQSRKRGTLESDLLLSTFADTYLKSMSTELLTQYDLFLDENDWDIYYWATQEPTPTSAETAEGSGSNLATESAQGQDQVQKNDEWKRAPASGEWAQTVGTFKPAYRPVPQRWKNSEILELLRDHVKSRTKTDGEEQGKGGLGMMPNIKSFDQ
ncbi:DUF339-domain-containing protein [Pleomassaria siparia CBS 279.74]|uniref:Succinate dehydrogenase assembly factor 2, mitochondrial n=1 Tax=Pleomassaria siparia CBS 279.74 TaxID=1314801 RepID=A0A6G1JSX3_9PLEO|nr:DUF339-domain-containing protein [Pleomassaria siparia CBS 279.74]